LAGAERVLTGICAMQMRSRSSTVALTSTGGTQSAPQACSRLPKTPPDFTLIARPTSQQNEQVEPLLESTIHEMRANDLFRWLRDFGPRFGWRQTGTLTKLQTEVNQGGVGIIVARRKEDGRSGHIVVVVPETQENTARRDASGEVVAPLQSQAGSSNFQYGRGKTNWWNGEEFAEAAFWIHA